MASRAEYEQNEMIKTKKIKAIKVILSYEIYRAFIVFQNDERNEKIKFNQDI